MAKGMRGFVRQTLELGHSLEKLQLQQQMAEDQGGDPQPSVKLMQENARLIVLTSEAGCPAAHKVPQGLLGSFARRFLIDSPPRVKWNPQSQCAP